jgi:hypothetical protein
MDNIQSIIIDKNIYTLSQANNWIKKHNYKLTFYGKPVDITTNFYRYRQQSPKKYENYKIKEISKGIKLVLGYN